MRICLGSCSDIGVASGINNHIGQNNPTAKRSGHNYADNLIALRHSSTPKAGKPKFGTAFQDLLTQPLGLLDLVPALFRTKRFIDLCGIPISKTVPIG